MASSAGPTRQSPNSARAPEPGDARGRASWASLTVRPSPTPRVAQSRRRGDPVATPDDPRPRATADRDRRVQTRARGIPDPPPPSPPLNRRFHDREDDGQDTFLPFANAENRALDSAIRAKERQLEDIEATRRKTRTA